MGWSHYPPEAVEVLVVSENRRPTWSTQHHLFHLTSHWKRQKNQQYKRPSPEWKHNEGHVLLFSCYWPSIDGQAVGHYTNRICYQLWPELVKGLEPQRSSMKFCIPSNLERRQRYPCFLRYYSYPTRSSCYTHSVDKGVCMLWIPQSD
jgi:hypothetical protein